MAEPMTMQNPAKKKLMLMIRRAGTPMAIMFSEALKMPSRVSGMVQNPIMPAIISATATKMHGFRVFVIRIR